MIPPHAGREKRQPAKPLRVAQAHIEGHQSAQRRAAHPGPLAIGTHPIPAGDPGHQLASHQQAVGVGLSAAHLQVALMGVFGQPPVAGVVDADNHQWLHFTGFDDRVGLVPQFPRTAGDERCPPVKQILSVVQIEHGICAFRVRVVVRRQVDNQVALIGQINALEIAVQP